MSTSSFLSSIRNEHEFIVEHDFILEPEFILEYEFILAEVGRCALFSGI